MDPQVETATAYALENARLRGEPEATSDDLLIGCLRCFSRFGVAEFGPWLIDLEELGVRWREPYTQGTAKVAYAESTVRLFDQAAAIAKADSFPNSGTQVLTAPLRLAHLLVAAFDLKQPESLMAAISKKHGISSTDWRAAAAHLLAASPRDPETVATGASQSAGREYLSPEEAAKELGVHVQTIRVYVRSGKIPALRLAGERAIRIRRTDLSKVLEPLPPSAEPGNR